MFSKWQLSHQDVFYSSLIKFLLSLIIWRLDECWNLTISKHLHLNPLTTFSLLCFLQDTLLDHKTVHTGTKRWCCGTCGKEHRLRSVATRGNVGIITYSISIFQEWIPSPVKSEFHVIQERIPDGSDWPICSAEYQTNSKWSHDKTCQSELPGFRSWGPGIRSWEPVIRSWEITLAGMFFLTYGIAYRTSIL